VNVSLPEQFQEKCERFSRESAQRFGTGFMTAKRWPVVADP